MNHSATVGLIAAMPEEVNPLLKRIGKYRRRSTGQFEIYTFSLGKKKCAIIRSGMGPINAEAAAKVLIRETGPTVIINFGFAGGLTEGPLVGDLIIAAKVLNYQHDQFSPQEGLTTVLFDKLHALLQALNVLEYSVYPGTVVTVTGIVAKKELAKLLPEDCPSAILDMETAAVAKVAAEADIPFAAIRAISDPANEELGFKIEEFTDVNLNVRLTKVLGTVVKRPWIIPQLLRLARNSTTAGKNLALGVEAVIKAI